MRKRSLGLWKGFPLFLVILILAAIVRFAVYECNYMLFTGEDAHDIVQDDEGEKKTEEDDLQQDEDDNSDELAGEEKTDEGEEDRNPQDKQTTASDDHFYYDQLNATEKRIYDAIYEAASQGKSSYTIRKINGAEYYGGMERASRAVVTDHPELFWLNMIYYTDIPQMKTNIDVTEKVPAKEFWTYTTGKDRLRQELDDAVDEIAVNAMKKGNDFDRIKYVHDYMINHCYYDHEGLDDVRKTMHSAKSEMIYTAYGCLVNQKCVCMGYAQAFKMIMNRMGYRCICVIGEAGATEQDRDSHAWNIIWIDDECYCMDVTWDDMNFAREMELDNTVSDAIYTYFCIDDKDISYDHIADTKFSMPKCTAEAYDYFHYNGYELVGYDDTSFSNIINNQPQDSLIAARCDSFDTLELAILNISGSYLTDADRNVIHIIR